jgi:hypothetical protein
MDGSIVILWRSTINCGHENPAVTSKFMHSHDAYMHISLNYARYPLPSIIIILL